MSVQPVVHSMINSIHTLKDHCGQNRDGNLKTKSLLCNCRTSTRPYLCCVSNYLHDLLSKSRFCLHTPIMIFGPSIYYVSKRTEWIQKMAAFADVQHCIYAQIVGGSAKVQKCADVIYGWSHLQSTSLHVPSLFSITQSSPLAPLLSGWFDAQFV